MADEPGTITTEDPPELDLEKVLNWNVETDGELPAEYQTLPLEKVKEYAATATERAAQAERERVAAELSAQREREQTEQSRRADLQSDIDWAAELDTRLSSSDDAVRQQAQLDKQNFNDRYVRGLAAKHSAFEEAVSTRVLASHYTPLIEALNAAGHEAFTSSISDRLAKTSNNPLLAAIEFGKELGIAQGSAATREEMERQARIASGQQGAPDMSGGTGGGGREDYSNPTWVTDQRSKDPEWPFKTSSDGKRTNLQRVREASVASARRAG